MPSPMPTTLQLCTISFCLCCQQDTRERNRYQSRYPKSRSITPSHTAFSLVLHYAQFKLSCSTLQFYYVHSHTMLLYQQWWQLQGWCLYFCTRLCSLQLTVQVVYQLLFFVFFVFMQSVTNGPAVPKQHILKHFLRYALDKPKVCHR